MTKEHTEQMKIWQGVPSAEALRRVYRLLLAPPQVELSRAVHLVCLVGHWSAC